MIPLDPLGFTLQALAARGALVEEAAGEAIAVVPPEVACALDLDEEARITLDAGAGGAVCCGLGTPLLERLLAAARARVPVAAVDIDAEPARPAQARMAAERLVVRNGLCDLVDVMPGEATYVAATVAWVAEADDRWEGMFTLVGECTSGAAPDESFAALLDPSRSAARRPARHGAPTEASAWIVRRSMLRAREAVADIQGSVARRLGRDHARIVDYFAALIAESRRPRRPTAAETIAARMAQLVAERDAKLRDLATRYALRVALAPAALVVARARVMNLQLHLRRRKGARDIAVKLPAGASRPDALACEGCPDVTTRPVLCDDRLHILCERCAPSAQGRPRCPACAATK